MIKLDIQEFIKENTFFPNEDENSIKKMVQNYCDTSFGEDNCMYYFNRKGYNITFVYDKLEDSIMAEQIEITSIDEIENLFLKNSSSIENYRKELNAQIDSIYYDESEEVIFMKNGINAHFNNGFLSKMTSKSDITRDLVRKIMLCSYQIKK